jgi:hypothetical protein
LIRRDTGIPACSSNSQPRQRLAVFFREKMLEMIQERHLNVSHEKEAGELS